MRRQARSEITITDIAVYSRCVRVKKTRKWEHRLVTAGLQRLGVSKRDFYGFCRKKNKLLLNVRSGDQGKWDLGWLEFN